MKKNVVYLSLSFLAFTNTISAQLFLPKFSAPVKQEIFSSEHEESSPLPYNNGKGIYYNRTYISGNNEEIEITGNDFWISTEDSKDWKRPYRVLREGEIPDNNILIGVAKDGDRMYLLNTTLNKKVLTDKLVYVDRIGKNKWSDPKELKIPDFTIKPGYLHFYVNPEETALIISKPPNENVKSEDIFISLKDTLTNRWGSPINLGKTINTRRNELGSFLSKDLKALYFSSDGHGGYGASDIFVSYRLDDSWTNWTEPLNLGESINSKDDESYYVVANKEEVYFVSDREGSRVNNIYKAVATGELVFANDSVKGKFVYRGLPVDNISLVIEDEFGNIVDELITDEFGNFQFADNKKLPSKYFIKIKGEGKEEYIGSKIYLTDKEGQPLERFVYTGKEQFTRTKEIKKETFYDGVLSYNKTPSINSGLIIIDENSFPVDTIYTNTSGQFRYGKSKYDKGLTIVPLNIEERNYKGVELVLMDKKTNSIHKIAPGVYQELDIKEVVAENHPGVDPLVEIANTNKAIEVINFSFNEYTLTNQENEKLSVIVKKLRSNPQLKVYLSGHTDNVGDDKANKRFGQLRANAVKEELLKRGIADSRITTTSKGSSTPMQTNTTKEGREKNRRVEIWIR